MYEATLAKFREMYERNEDCCCPAEFIPIEEALKKQNCFNCGQRLDWEAKK